MTYQTSLRPLGYQQITSLAAAVALTVPAGCGVVRITPSGAGVRWRDDGVNPTATVGYPLAAGAELVYQGSFANLRIIEQTASAVLDIVYCAA